MANIKYLASPPGLLQIVHLVFGIISIGCGAASYESQFFKEKFFLWAVVSVLILSVVLLVLSVVSGHGVIRAVSSAFHVIGGILQLVAGTLMILSVKYIGDKLCTPRPFGGDCNFDKDTKLAAASFAIINGILYLVASALIVTMKTEDDDGYEEAGGETRKFGRPRQ